MRDLTYLTAGALHSLSETGLLNIVKAESTRTKLELKAKPIRVEVLKDTEHYNTDVALTILIDYTARSEAILLTFKTKTNLEGQYLAENTSDLLRFLTTFAKVGVKLKGQRMGEEFSIRVSQMDVTLREQSLFILQSLSNRDDIKAHVDASNFVVVKFL